MFHLNPDIRKKNLLEDLLLPQLYAASSINDFLTHKHSIVPTLNPFHRGHYWGLARVIFPSAVVSGMTTQKYYQALHLHSVPFGTSLLAASPEIKLTDGESVLSVGISQLYDEKLHHLKDGMILYSPAIAYCPSNERMMLRDYEYHPGSESKQ